jgi:predicted transposase/invertase (TIGR01784 family)
MGKFINPFTDVGFKKIFGQEITKDLLIDFLNGLLVNEKSITDITFLDKELLPEYMGDRGVIYDIYCTTESGEQFIVEMQNKQQTNFKERALFYLSHTVARQGERGAHWQFDLKAVYGVFFLNFCLADAPHKLRTDVVLADRDTHETFSDKLRFIFIELPSFHKEESECETDFERWIYVLKNMDTLKRMPFKARKSVFEKLEKIVDIASLTKEERMKYDESIKVFRDQLATISFAEEKGWRKGLERGMEEGMEKGMEKGMKKGVEKGMKEKSWEIARNLKKLGVSTDTISQASGLSVEEIENI